MTVTAALLVLLTAAAAAASPLSPRQEERSEDLCSHHCANHQPHTLDRYPPSGAAAVCGTVAGRGVSAAERADIVSGHNAIRRAVQAGQYAAQNLPPAGALAELRWDGELAEVAQRWADQCVIGHDQCRDVARFPVGQNYAYVWSAGERNWTAEALGQWFSDELPLFRQEGLLYGTGRDPVSGGYTGHLTQLLWADTSRVGCGFIAVADPLYNERRTYICNYGPAGNVDAQQIYPART